MKKIQPKDNRPFAERHPKWNLTICVIILLALAGLAGYIAFKIVYYIGIGIYEGVSSVANPNIIP